MHVKFTYLFVLGRNFKF